MSARRPLIISYSYSPVRVRILCLIAMPDRGKLSHDLYKVPSSPARLRLLLFRQPFRPHLHVPACSSLYDPVEIVDSAKSSTSTLVSVNVIVHRLCPPKLSKCPLTHHVPQQNTRPHPVLFMPPPLRRLLRRHHLRYYLLRRHLCPP